MQVENTEAHTNESVEKEARLLGWVPKEDFRDGDSWVDADTFVKRGKEINPILRKNNETLLKKLDQANAEIAEVKKAAKEFQKFQQDLADRKVKEISSELDRLKQSKKDAISQGDGEQVIAIEEQIDTLKEEQRTVKEEAKAPQEPAPKAPQIVDPIVSAWMDKNDWFGVDKKMTAIANVLGTDLNAERPDLRGQAFFEELDRRLQEEYPERLGKQGRGSPVEGTSRSTSRPTPASAQSYKNLPADAKAACDRFVKQGLMTQEQYVADYSWN